MIPDDFQGFLCVLFSMDAGALTQAQMDALRAMNVAWEVLNRRVVNSIARWYVDIIGPKSQLVQIGQALTSMGRNPIVLGVFTPTIQPDQSVLLVLTQGNLTEYLNVAPDVVTYDAQGNVLSTTRPTGFIDVHRWAGWPDKSLT
jgi:YD repeat-containing protein